MSPQQARVLAFVMAALLMGVVTASAALSGLPICYDQEAAAHSRTPDSSAQVRSVRGAVKPKPVRFTKHALTAKQAQDAQQAWAEHLGFKVAVKNSIGMQLRVIPPGTYRMGSLKGEAGRKRNNEGPVEVTLSQAFLIGQFEVTQGEWRRVMGASKRNFRHGAGDRFPMYAVNHSEARTFCTKLTRLDREAGSLPAGYEYRLPTDAEWEYACRAGTLTATWFGNKLSSTQANFNGKDHPYNGAEKGPNLGRAAKVGSYPANPWGLHEMHGNLCEWCLDWYYHEVEGGVDPVRLAPAPDWSQPAMVVRDCKWGYYGHYCRSANRYHAPPRARANTIGFRVVLTRSKPKQKRR